MSSDKLKKCREDVARFVTSYMKTDKCKEFYLNNELINLYKDNNKELDVMFQNSDMCYNYVNLDIVDEFNEIPHVFVKQGHNKYKIVGKNDNYSGDIIYTNRTDIVVGRFEDGKIVYLNKEKILSASKSSKTKNEKNYSIGYTQGVFDMFHIGHLNIINRAKQQCEYLIVGVNSDSLVKEYKNKTTVINEEDRAEIVRNIKAVDECIIVDTLDKMKIHKEKSFDAIFIGDDWKGNARWLKSEEELAEVGAEVVYLPHTPDVSSTGLRGEVGNSVNG